MRACGPCVPGLITYVTISKIDSDTCNLATVANALYYVIGRLGTTPYPTFLYYKST